MNERIVAIIGASVLLCIVGALALSAFTKTPPEWSGDIVKIGLGGLVGLVTGQSTKKDPPTTPPSGVVS